MDPEPEPPNAGAGDAAKATAILALVAAVVTFELHGGRAAASVLVGAAVGIANLLTMQAVLQKLVRETAKGRGAPAWAILAAAKILFLLGLLAYLLTRRYVDPMPLAVGYMAMPFGIVASAVWTSLRPRY